MLLSTCASWPALATPYLRHSARTVSLCPACTRSAAHWNRARRTCPGPATPKTPTSSTFPRSAPLFPTAPATGATPCWARSAWPCASPPPWPVTRAGWPSTCSSSEWRSRTAAKPMSPPPFPAPAGKPISPCSSRPRRWRATRSPAWATTSPGSSPGRTATSTPSTPKLDSLAWPPAPPSRRTPTPSLPARRTRSLRM